MASEQRRTALPESRRDLAATLAAVVGTPFNSEECDDSGAAGKSQPNLFDGQLLTIEQIAKEFGRSTRTIARWCKRDDFVQRVKVGSRIYSRREAVLEFFKANETKSGRRGPRRTRRKRDGAAV